MINAMQNFIYAHKFDIYIYPYSLKDDSDTLNPFTLILRAKKKKILLLKTKGKGI